MSTDIKFTYAATDYEYMLAVDADGQKKWHVRQLFSQPPSLIKNKIDLTIKAAPSVRQTDNKVVAVKDIATVMTQLRVLVSAANITLLGLDGRTYYVTLDSNATLVRSVADETGRIVEYEIDIACWDLYQAS